MALQAKAAAVHGPRHGRMDPCTGLAAVLFERPHGWDSDTYRDGRRLRARQRRRLCDTEEGSQRDTVECGPEGSVGRDPGRPSLARWGDAHWRLGTAVLRAGEREERGPGQMRGRR